MKKYTLQGKITKTFIGVFAAVILIVAMSISVIISNIYGDKSYQLCEQLVSVNLELLNNNILEIQRTQKIIAQNTAVKEAVKYYRNVEVKDYGKELQYARALDEELYLLAENSGVSSAYIIDKEGNYIYFYKESLKQGYNMLQEEWYRSLTEKINMNICYVSGLHDRGYLVNENDTSCVSIVKPILTASEYTFTADAFLVCDIEMGAVLNNSGDREDMQFIVMSKDEELYSTDSLMLTEGKKEEVLNFFGQGEEKTSYKNGDDGIIALSMESELFGWQVIGVRSRQEISYCNRAILIISVLTILLAICTVIVLSKKVSRSILIPMNSLIKECDQVAAGDYNIQFTEKKSEEISFLSDTIRDMVSNIVRLSDKVLEDEKQLSEEKLRVLQHQINPHFLNNVLQAIKALAVEGETEKISRMSTLLGHILAYSVYEPYENVKLSTELQYLRYYIELQNIRFENQIIFSIDCEHEAEDTVIPKLTLQPLAENSIEHGFDRQRRILLDISAECEGDVTYILMTDNGRGIEKDELEQLNRQLKAVKYTGKEAVSAFQM